MKGAYGQVLAAGLLLAALTATVPVRASGASPYLPLNLSPEIERKIEQVLILANDPVMRRPVPIERVLTALPKACARDRKLCTQVRHYLDRYFHSAAVTHASAELAAANHSTTALPNERGERVDAPWDASVVASYRPFDHLLLSAGGVAYGGTDGRFIPDGTMLSFGDEYAQLDAGYRAHWLSPLTDSSMLVSTEAPTMPSVTLSNQQPISPAGFDYELFLGRMSYANRIVWQGGYTAGDPRLAGLHLGIAPLPGWAFAGTAVYQFGGGARAGSLTGLIDSLFKRTDPTDSVTATDSRFANRTVSLTSAYTFPAKTPLETYVEYAARDTLHGELYRFHQTSLSAGVHVPELLGRFDLTLEGSEWQNGWYSDYVWLEGMTEDGYVTGNWGADWRNPGEALGAHSGMAQLAFALPSGDLVNLRYRLLQNQSYAGENYSLGQMATFQYAQPRNGYTRGLTLDTGRNVFGAGFVRLAAFVRFDGGNQGSSAADDEESNDADASDADASGRGAGEQTSDEPAAPDRRLERFVDVGASGGKLGLDLGGFSATSEAAQPHYQDVVSPHLGIGVRGAISANADLGVRAEFDDFKGLMLALRILDYRYRLGEHLAVGGFAGLARYSGPTPAQGYYFGLGLQWLDLWHQWDLSLDARFFNALQRDKLLPSDQTAAQNGDPVEWYLMQAPSLYLSHRF